MSGVLRSLILKSAKIQKKIDELQRAGADWVTLVRLKQIRLKLSDRIHHLADNMVPEQSSRFAPVRVPVHRRHFRFNNRT